MVAASESPTSPPKLSVLISSLTKWRAALCLELASLRTRVAAESTEVLIAIDDIKHSVDVKRERLLAQARGDSVVFVDEHANPGNSMRRSDATAALERARSGSGTGSGTGSGRLTICVPSLWSRAEVLARLLGCLARQPRADEIEIVIAIDGGQATTGAKRNQLVSLASGAYICHVDDDDLVAPDYIATILAAIEASPGVDVVYLRGQRRIPGDHPWDALAFDFGCDEPSSGHLRNGALVRQVGHLCPVRAELAKATLFPDLTVGEDLRWGKALAPKIRTSARAGQPGQVLYYYEFDPYKKARSKAIANPGAAGAALPSVRNRTPIADLAPWKIHRLPPSPWPGTWGFNPSIVRIPDDATGPHAGKWLCVIRCANYHLPGSTSSHPAQRIANRNWLLELDSSNDWRSVFDCEIRERVPVRVSGTSTHVLGYEDLRLAWSPQDGLIASATSMAHNETGTLEIVVLELDEGYQIRSAQPLRGPWSDRHQKNWMPILGGPSVRWLYSPQGGAVRERSSSDPDPDPVPVPDPDLRILPGPGRDRERGRRRPHAQANVTIRPGPIPPARRQATASPRNTPLALRGGTQLVPVPELGPDRYLGLVHACEIGEIKEFTHQVALASGSGKLIATSRPLKLSPEHGIEFAAGLARDPGSQDRIVITYGIEDDSAWLAETSLDALISLLETK